MIVIEGILIIFNCTRTPKVTPYCTLEGSKPCRESHDGFLLVL